MNLFKLISLGLLAYSSSSLSANVEPTVIINSAAMRNGTTLMDVSYRVNDPDDATVKTRALAFVDGVRSFANVLRPETFAEGTDANLGDTITTNTNHTLTWDVGADWDVDLGQVKFEVLAQDSRGLLEFDWITIPAAGGEPELTISQNPVSNPDVLDALFWLYASSDEGLDLVDGVLTGSHLSGTFENVKLVDGSVMKTYASPYVMKASNLQPADVKDLDYANFARAKFNEIKKWHAKREDYTGTPMIHTWGSSASNAVYGFVDLLDDFSTVRRIDGGYFWSIALQNDGTIRTWGRNEHNVLYVPSSQNKDIVDVQAGWSRGLALKKDGTVFVWGQSLLIPEGLDDVTAISLDAEGSNCLALKEDGTVVAFGNDYNGQATVPQGLTDVIAIDAGPKHSMALKSDGTVVCWGEATMSAVPANLTDVVAIAASGSGSIALKNDGTVASWGYSSALAPEGLENVKAISADGYVCAAIHEGGNVTIWGSSSWPNSEFQHLSNVLSVNGGSHLFIKTFAP